MEGHSLMLVLDALWKKRNRRDFNNVKQLDQQSNLLFCIPLGSRLGCI